jgi:hypothetical protein
LLGIFMRKWATRIQGSVTVMKKTTMIPQLRGTEAIRRNNRHMKSGEGCGRPVVAEKITA